ncbi:hypothetical protein M8998_01005 [Sphingobacterium sp. lm-10]|uniref:hypothetical protein n=1 Tax=Sphingobacterium sp. lm-10 TaxID=2944904 RepID=UPI00202269EC|nr:hypothetical protein [Sphingobacterium sp. lm-10]MCL7986508.1 hypothetical protein [Sphingobacterium sp. lm-10]
MKNNNSRRKYVSPDIQLSFVQMECSMAAGSNVQIGGGNNGARPEIMEDDPEEQFYDFEF